MDIDKDLIIGINSKATLSNNDFLGSKAIVLSIGDINSPINEGDTIMSEKLVVCPNYLKKLLQ